MAKHKTPLRYPGGKQKLSPFMLEIIEQNDLLGGNYVEPYAGGAGIAIELLLSGKASIIHLNDSSSAIYSFWYAILNHPEEFCRRVSRASLSNEEWKKQKDILIHSQEHSKLDLGFAAFFLNRCNRSGILSAGVIGGIKQTGKWKMDARFARNDLIRRIEVIAQKKKNIKIRNWDAEKYIRSYVGELPEKTLVYIDPPYFHKANRLYLDHYDPDDHERIAKVVQEEISHLWVVSYDNAPEIRRHYAQRRSFTYSLQYNAAKAYQGTEVFVFSDGLSIPSHSSLPYIDDALCVNNS